MKKLLLATALTFTIAAPTASVAGVGDDAEALRGWTEDIRFIRSHKHDPNPAVQHCAAEMEDDMKANWGALVFAVIPGSYPLLPAANHFRENTIMPWFENCVNEARSQ